jgi:hypothetical protein
LTQVGVGFHTRVGWDAASALSPQLGGVFDAGVRSTLVWDVVTPAVPKASGSLSGSVHTPTLSLNTQSLTHTGFLEEPVMLLAFVLLGRALEVGI